MLFSLLPYICSIFKYSIFYYDIFYLSCCC
uniref:Uncharacterized protein n=1 Tax=Myoviridae sp. ctkOm7 TaxID=2826690 RepID=A0A8S5NMZ5_9CAUD|nr:MAG TPA: hypothetical protein [Myoviridae sp. ctkOm7]